MLYSYRTKTEGGVGWRLLSHPGSMKIRLDFVTNSSSSSFILAQQGDDFTEKQKAAILDYVSRLIKGEVILTPESTEEEIQNVFEEHYFREEQQDRIRKALAEGKWIQYGSVSFEESDWHLADIFQKLWDSLEEAGPDTFTVIDGDLSY